MGAIDGCTPGLDVALTKTVVVVPRLLGAKSGHTSNDTVSSSRALEPPGEIFIRLTVCSPF